MGLIQIWQRGGMAFSSFDTLFLSSLSRCVRACVCWHMPGGQRSTYGMLSISFEIGSFTGLTLPIRLD